MLCTKVHVHAWIKAHRRFYTQNLLHRETIAQNSFYTKRLLHRKTLTQQKCPHRLHTQVFTHRNFCVQKLYPEQLLHTETCPPHRSLYAQKSLCTAVFTQTLLPRDAFTQKNFCTQHAFTHSQLLHREALFPLLDHLFPFSSSSWISRKNTYKVVPHS